MYHLFKAVCTCLQKIRGFCAKIPPTNMAQPCVINSSTVFSLIRWWKWEKKQIKHSSTSAHSSQLCYLKFTICFLFPIAFFCQSLFRSLSERQEVLSQEWRERELKCAAEVATMTLPQRAGSHAELAASSARTDWQRGFYFPEPSTQHLTKHLHPTVQQ